MGCISSAPKNVMPIDGPSSASPSPSSPKESSSKSKTESVPVVQPASPTRPETTPSIPLKFELLYTTGRVLGSGGFSTAVEATSKLNPNVTVAAKITKKKLLTPEDVEGIKSEIRIMKGLNHENIVGYVDDFEDDENYYVCLELLKGGELFDRIVKKTSYNELDARNLFQTIVGAVKFLHDRDIVHRDLKPENLLMLNDVDDAAVKIADFGFAKEAKGNSLTTLCGSPGYVAPEILLKQKYGKPVDMWAVGVITYIILVGYPPFYDEQGRQAVIFGKIKRAEYDFDPTYWSGVSNEAMDLIRQLLCFDPNTRLTASECLKHPWLHKSELHQKDLGENLQRLRNYNALRKLKAATRAVIAVRRMSQMLGGSDEADHQEEYRGAEPSPAKR